MRCLTSRSGPSTTGTLGLAVCLGLIPLACDNAAVSAVVTRDSAGIRIVENHVPVWTTAPEWSVNPRPIVSIGDVEGAGDTHLHRVTGAARLADGRIVIAHAGSQELRYHSSSGDFLYSTGRAGSGPGEFRSLMRLSQFPGDSILTFDGSLYRFSVFDKGGRLIRTFSPPLLEGGLSYPLTLGRGGDIVMANAEPMSARLPGLQQDSALLYIIDRSGVFRDSIGRFPIRESFVTFRGAIRTTLARPFSPYTSATVLDGKVVLTTSESHRLDIHDATGVHLRSIHTLRARQPVTEEEIATYKEARGTGRPSIDHIPIPQEYPAFSALHADPAGYIWAEVYPPPGTRNQRWLIYDLNGRWLGEVRGPDHFYLLELGTDYLLGIATDNADVQRVQLFGLTRGTRP